MSMSQEEIEALMNGLDIAGDENEPAEVSEPTKVNTKEIEELLSQTEEVSEEKEKVSEPEVLVDEKKQSIINNDEIDDLLKDIETSSPIEEVSSNEIISELNTKVEITSDEKKDPRSEDDIVKDWTSSKINEGVFPLPAERETKVVNQLSQVANDSEEKVSQIFDVLSLALDNNNEVRKASKEYENFLLSQINLLNSLNTKFPNIKVFDEYLISAKAMDESLSKLKNLLNDEDTQIFQAMELMQFNDINRQKIERVMSVIRKLSLYLNNLFEDDGETKDIAVAKHIHGDEAEDLIGEDLDKLIEEFSKNK